MNLRTQLQLANTATSAYNVGLVLMTDMGWRLWRHVGREEFPAYHQAWWFGRHGLQPILWPGVGLNAVGALAQLRWRPQTVPRWMPASILVLLATNGLVTAIWWGRQQGQLEQAREPDGSLTRDYERLINTHWARVALITLAATLQLTMTARTLAEDVHTSLVDN